MKNKRLSFLDRIANETPEERHIRLQGHRDNRSSAKNGDVQLRLSTGEIVMMPASWFDPAESVTRRIKVVSVQEALRRNKAGKFQDAAGRWTSARAIGVSTRRKNSDSAIEAELDRQDRQM